MTDNPGETAPTSVSRAATKMVEVTSLARASSCLRSREVAGSHTCIWRPP